MWQNFNRQHQNPIELNLKQLQSTSRQFLQWIAKHYGISHQNYIKPGIGEATRVLLRREAQLLLLQDLGSEATRHLRWLAEFKSIPIAVFTDLPYRAVALIYAIAVKLNEHTVPAVFKMHNAMCEVATHQQWGSSIINRQQCYGVKISNLQDKCAELSV